MIGGQSLAMEAAAASPNGKVPRCEHLDGLALVRPQAEDCQDCRTRKDHNDPRVSLVVCQTCGWVACSDESPHQHAREHYEETDHPVAAGFAPGSAWRWCYVHRRLV